MSLGFSEVAEIALIVVQLGQFQQLMKKYVILILNNFTRSNAITYTDGEIKSKHKPPVCSLIRVSVNQCSGYLLGCD